MLRSADQQHIDDLARRRLDVLLAELGGQRPSPPAGDLRGPARTVWEDRPPPRGRHAHRPLTPAARVRGWVGDRLPETLRGRVGLGGSQLAVVALLVACGVLWAAWSTSRSGDAAPVAAPVVTTPSATAPGGSADPSTLAAPAAAPAPSGAAAGPAAAELVVDVQGTVRRPGIVVLPAGARVVDALEEAGGYTGRPARLAAVNLARPVVDGEQIVVGRRAPAPAAGPSGADSSAGAAPLVSLNTADQVTLETLPGVGPVTATAILQWRADNGPFTSVDQLLEVSGIGEATLAEIAPHVTL